VAIFSLIQKVEIYSYVNNVWSKLVTPVGPKGDKTIQGNQGDKGDKGDQGSPESIVSSTRACSSAAKKTIVMRTTDNGFALYAILDRAVGMQQLDPPDATACMLHSQSTCTNACNIWTIYTNPVSKQSTTGCLAAYSTTGNGNGKCSFWIDCLGNVVLGT
jgi:hypothetical protein